MNNEWKEMVKYYKVGRGGVKRHRIVQAVDIVAMLCLLCLLTELFYRQSVLYGGRYLSDLTAHINAGISGKGYSLITSQVFRILYKINGTTWWIAVFLACVCVMTVGASALFLKQAIMMRHGKRISYALSGLISLLFLTFLSGIYVPGLYGFFYKGTAVGQPWHNSTYLCMRLVGILVLTVYFRIERTYLEHIAVRDWLLFAFLLLMVNAIKPNFILAFAPVMGLKLLIDLIKTKGKGIIPILKFGCAVLISLPVLLYQADYLYGQNQRANVIVVIWGKRFFAENPVPFLLFSLAFPIFVLAFNMKSLKSDSVYAGSWLLFLTAFLESVILSEASVQTGSGNLGWGRLFFGYFLFAASVYKALGNWIDRKAEDRKPWYFLCAALLCLANVISGVFYFVICLSGANCIC